MEFHGKEYTEVKDRIVEFLARHTEGMIHTSVEWSKEDFSAVCIKAVVHPVKTEQDYFFTGLAYEERAGSGVNTDSWVENCETSAIGRALANMNIGVNGTRPSAEEMKKVNKTKTLKQSPAPKLDPLEPPKTLSVIMEVAQSFADAIGDHTEVIGLRKTMDEAKVRFLAGDMAENEYDHLRALANDKLNQIKGAK
jgi:hypothetical protein